MIEEKTITICGKEVQMRYCLAAEQGYEKLTGKSIDVFNPTILSFTKDGKPNEVANPEARQDDYRFLGFAAIIAAYDRNGQEPPITPEELKFDTTKEEIDAIINAVVDLRLKWYNIPSVVKSEFKQRPEDREKNA